MADSTGPFDDIDGLLAEYTAKVVAGEVEVVEVIDNEPLDTPTEAVDQ